MNDIDPTELSGLIDGELTPQRAAEVRLAMESNPALRAEYGALLALHQRCHQSAQSAAFRPRITLSPAPTAPSPWLLALTVMVLLVVHLLPKVMDAFTTGVLLNMAAPAVLALGLRVYGAVLSTTPGRWLTASEGSEP